MVRLARWRLVFAAAIAFAMISSPPNVYAQNASTATSAPGVPGSTAPATTKPATTTPPFATEAATTSLPATEAATTPTETQAVTTTPPVSTPTATNPATTVPVNTDIPTTSTPTTPPSTSQPASEASAPPPQDTTSPQSTLRSSPSAGEFSRSSSSKSVSESTTGILNGPSSTKIAVICVLGGVGLAIIVSLLLVVRRIQKREDPELGTPPAPPTATFPFPPASMPLVAAPTTQEMSAWKSREASFVSRDLPLGESTRKMNATTRSTGDYDMAYPHFGSVPGTQTPQVPRETNASSEQSFSIRGYSELSVSHADESEASATTNERDSINDGYSTSDRYSTNGRQSTSSRVSSEIGRSNSGWFQRQVPKKLDMHRFSSTSSVASSTATRKHKPTSSFIDHDLTKTPSTVNPVTTDSTTSRTDVPDWYSVIESPQENDRYTTASSLESGDERESFEL